MNKFTLTIGVPAYNEEKGIIALLESINSQIQSSYKLKQVIINCDGCTDRTVLKAKKFKTRKFRIKVIDNKSRRGQALRLTQLFKLAHSDLFITLDADVVLENNRSIEEAIKPFYHKNIEFIGGNHLPIETGNLLNSSIIAYDRFWRKVIKTKNHGNNIYNFPGCFWGARTVVLKKLIIPSYIVASDHYVYLSLIKKDNFKYANKAVCYYNTPQTLSDYLKQSNRFNSSHTQILDAFHSSVTNHYHIPKKIKIYTFISEIFVNPTYISISALLQAMDRLYAFLFNKTVSNNLWSQTTSSK